MDKYYISINGVESQVCKKEFIKMEETCGFYPKIPGNTATSGFFWNKGSINIKGRILFNYSQKDEEF